MSERNNAQLPRFDGHKNRMDSCPQEPGTLIRIFIPPGTVINLLNLIEIASPGGICLIIRIPLLGGLADSNGKTLTLADIKKAIADAGGTIEVM
jgi:hypothetical protein